MASKRRPAIAPVKANEGMAARWLCRMFGVPDADSVLRAVEMACADAGDDGGPSDVTSALFGDGPLAFYPWDADLMDIMGDTPGPLAEELMLDPSTRFVVRDPANQGTDSLWMATAAVTPDLWELIRQRGPRTVVHGHAAGDSRYVIAAIQISSCLR